MGGADKRVLIVEDHPLLAGMMADLLREELGCTVLGPASTVREGLDLARAQGCDVALVDLTLPDGHGMEVIRELQQAGVRCAAVTGLPRSAEWSDVRWLEKPVDPDDVCAFVLEDDAEAGRAP